MVNRVVNTPVAINVYNGRAIRVNRHVTKPCVRQADGTLWCLVADHSCDVNLYRSTDNGFSWGKVRESIQAGSDMREQAGFNSDGFMGYIVIDERYRNLDIYMGEWESIGSDGALERKRYDLDDDTSSPTNTTVLDTTDDPYQGGSFDICHNHQQTFVTWLKNGGDMYVTRCSPRSTSVSSDLALGSGETHFGFISTVCDKDSKVYIAYSTVDGSDRKLRFVVYDSTTPSFNTPVTVDDVGASPGLVSDIAIARDGYDNLCIAYYDEGADEVKYALSTDSGANWTVTALTRTSGHAFFNDATTSDSVGRTNIIGGSRGGFIITYCEDNVAGTPRCYIRELTTSDGSTYTLGDEKEVATRDPWGTDTVVGVQFFHPTDVKLLDISDPGLVRIAFQVGEGDTTNMQDTVPVSIGQELLYESAYPSSLSSESGSHSVDTADSRSLLVMLDIHAGPDSSINWYSAGFIGNHTTRFLSAFDKIGTNIRLLKYEPNADNLLDDRSAYTAPVESSSLAILVPSSYGFPTPSIDAAEVESWVERDVRRIYLPPDTFLGRTFLVNKGGYLKRTVWTCEYFDNEYEISQIVPKFLSNQLCYYVANVYVVGPSRDPWSRTILPSET